MLNQSKTNNIATRAAVDAGKIYYHTNLLGSKTYTTHADNTIASWQEFDVWGTPLKPVHLDLNQKSVDDAVEYTNHNYDKVLGLYYAKARMYDPLAHRFAGRDVARSGRNWYGYVNNNPASKKRPDGIRRTCVGRRRPVLPCKCAGRGGRAVCAKAVCEAKACDCGGGG